MILPISDQTIKKYVHYKNNDQTDCTLDQNKEYLLQVIQDGGYYGDSLIQKDTTRWNSILVFDNDDHIYRGRIETLVVNDQDEVFLKFYPKGHPKATNGRTYCVPGGSTEKDVDNIRQAENECNEEALMKVKNIKSTGLSYTELKEPPAWAKDQPVQWNGYYTEVYVGEYDGKYTKQVEKVDQDKFTASGKFYKIDDVWTSLIPVHKQALHIMYPDKFGKHVIKESVQDILRSKKPIRMTYKNSYRDEVEILKQLSSDELDNLGLDGGDISMKPNPDCIYREVLYLSNKPIGFIEVIQDAPLKMLDSARVLLAVTPKFKSIEIRRHGYGKILVKRMMLQINSGNRRKVRYLIWKDGSVVSNTLAEKLGFTKSKNTYQFELIKQFPDGRFMNEKALTSEERKRLHEDTFGIPELRKYPLNDKEHVLAAIRFYHHVEDNKSERKYAASLANRIFDAMDKFHISKDRITPQNPLYRRLHRS